MPLTIISKDSEDTIALTPKADIAVRILDRAELVLRLKAQGSRLSSGSRLEARDTDVNPLAEHLRFYQELGVTGVSADRKWRERTPMSAEELGIPPTPDEARSDSRAGDLARSEAEALAAIREDSATARAASCTRRVERKSYSVWAIHTRI